MDAIDLLLDAGDTVEKVHQAAWFVLLQNSDFNSALGLPTGGQCTVLWEPDGGIFDLAVKSEDETTWIELKVDSDLGEVQVKRQFEHAKAGRVIHALLGVSNVRSRPWLTKTLEEYGGTLFTAAEVSQALRHLANAAGTPRGVQELARSYAAQLERLTKRGEDFRTTDSWCSLHDLYFFEQLRQACAEMKDAVICYVANPSGGFEACHWGWAGAGNDVDCYLQWEGRRLCFKVAATEPAVRRTVRTTAVGFLRDKPLGRTTIKRPARLGSGQTMTVGIVEDLPIRDEDQWLELVQSMSDATQLVAKLARHLASIRGDVSR